MEDMMSDLDKCKEEALEELAYCQVPTMSQARIAATINDLHTALKEEKELKLSAMMDGHDLAKEEYRDSIRELESENKRIKGELIVSKAYGKYMDNRLEAIQGDKR